MILSESTLFPYTTLFRSLFVGDLGGLAREQRKNLEFLLARADKHKARVVSFTTLDARTLAEKHEFDAGTLARLSELRSEEHTSELQSQSNIVCRLLLEKK